MIRMREVFLIEWRHLVNEAGELKTYDETETLKDNIMCEYETFEEFIKNCNEIKNYKIDWILECLETGVSLDDSIKYDPVTGVHFIKRCVLLEET